MAAGPGVDRRSFLRMAAATAAAGYGLPALLAACSDGGGSAPGDVAAVGPEAESFDPDRPFWVQGNFAPVTEEVTEHDLEVTGALPPELSGLYVRNGSNPTTGTAPHWFLGDGMVHGVRLENGRARWYRNRYVRTELYEAGDEFGGSGPPGGARNQSNVSVFQHAGTLLTSGEVGFPYEISPDDLSTVGPHDFGGRLTTAMTAHPKIDPGTGRMHFFGYGFVPPYLTYHVADADGRLVTSEEVAVAGPTMIHDFAITDRDVVFWECPVVFDLQEAVRALEDPESGSFGFRWDASYGARIGVMPLGGPATSIRWVEVDPFYVFHGVNAFRDGPDVVVDACRYDSMFDGTALGGELTLRRWRIDTSGPDLRFSEDTLGGREAGELPTRDPRRVGRDYRYGYLVGLRDHGAESDDIPEFAGVVRHDLRTGTKEVWDPGPSRSANEFLFVPAGDGEGDGYLLTYLHDRTTDRSSFVVLDATAVTDGPVASVALPQRVPYGFHAAWVPA